MRAYDAWIPAFAGMTQRGVRKYYFNVILG